MACMQSWPGIPRKTCPILWIKRDVSVDTSYVWPLPVVPMDLVCALDTRLHHSLLYTEVSSGFGQF